MVTERATILCHEVWLPEKSHCRKLQKYWHSPPTMDFSVLRQIRMCWAILGDTVSEWLSRSHLINLLDYFPKFLDFFFYIISKYFW